MAVVAAQQERPFGEKAEDKLLKLNNVANRSVFGNDDANGVPHGLDVRHHLHFPQLWEKFNTTSIAHNFDFSFADIHGEALQLHCRKLGYEISDEDVLLLNNLNFEEVREWFKIKRHHHVRVNVKEWRKNMVRPCGLYKLRFKNCD